MTKRILLTEPIQQSGMELLRERADVVLAEDASPQALRALIRNADGLIARNTEVSAETLNMAKNLKVIASHGAGTDHIDVDAATRAGIYVVNTPGANAESVAEAVVGLLLAGSRRLFEASQAFQSEKDYSLRHRLLGGDLHKKTIGIVGMGKIGQKLARICRGGFAMRVLFYDPYVAANAPEALGSEKRKALEEMLPEVDFLSLNCPYTPALFHLINAERLKLLKPGAGFVNCARGLLVDEDALYDSLIEKRLSFAALDVFSQEPPCLDKPLYALPNVITTPHIAAFAKDSIDLMSLTSARDVLCILEGRIGEANIVNPAAGAIS